MNIQRKLEEIKRPKTASQIKFEERFEQGDFNNSTKLTSWGCMQRHKLTKNEMFNTEQANIRMNMELPNREDRAEQRLQIKLHHFLQKGYKLRPDESLEDFITRSEEDEREL